jgi:hypothetical protein
MLHRKIVIMSYFLEFVLWIVGSVLIWQVGGWKAFVAAFCLLWADNLMLRHNFKRKH